MPRNAEVPELLTKQREELDRVAEALIRCDTLGAIAFRKHLRGLASSSP
jgi:hypothetical protein